MDVSIRQARALVAVVRLADLVPAVRAAPIDAPELERKVLLIRRAGRALSPAAQALADALQAVVGGAAGMGGTQKKAVPEGTAEFREETSKKTAGQRGCPAVTALITPFLLQCEERFRRGDEGGPG